MVGALLRGLTLQDFETLTVGMLVDYIRTYNDVDVPHASSRHAEPVRARPACASHADRPASQQDYDRF